MRVFALFHGIWGSTVWGSTDLGPPDLDPVMYSPAGGLQSRATRIGTEDVRTVLTELGVYGLGVYSLGVYRSRATRFGSRYALTCLENSIGPLTVPVV